MPRGSRPGERRGGRKTGTPNRSTLEKRAIIEREQREAAAVVPEVAQQLMRDPNGGRVTKTTARLLGKEVMRECMMFFRGLAGRHQPGGPAPDMKLCIQYLKLAGEFADKLAPYESPRLAAIQVSPDDGVLDRHADLSGLNDAELRQFERLARKIAPAFGNSGGDSETQH